MQSCFQTHGHVSEITALIHEIMVLFLNLRWCLQICCNVSKFAVVFLNLLSCFQNHGHVSKLTVEFPNLMSCLSCDVEFAAVFPNSLVLFQNSQPCLQIYSCVSKLKLKLIFKHQSRGLVQHEMSMLFERVLWTGLLNHA